MPKIIYVEASGVEHNIQVKEGFNLMEGAVLNEVPGIEGICGGMCVCATCHCYISPEDSEKYHLPAADSGELLVLDDVSRRQSNSRLSCQITVDATMQGLKIYLPETQS